MLNGHFLPSCFRRETHVYYGKLLVKEGLLLVECGADTSGCIFCCVLSYCGGESFLVNKFSLYAL